MRKVVWVVGKEMEPCADGALCGAKRSGSEGARTTSEGDLSKLEQSSVPPRWGSCTVVDVEVVREGPSYLVDIGIRWFCSVFTTPGD